MARAAEDRFDGPLLRLMLVMLLGGVVGLLDATIVNVGVDTLAGRLGVPLSTIQWVATGYLLAFAVAVPASGWATDRFGAKRLWLAGLTLFLAGSALSAAAPDAYTLIGSRAVQGLGAGTLEPVLMTVLAAAAGPRRMPRMMAVLGAVVALAPVVGPVAGGLIVGHLNWRWMFLINLPVCAVALALAVRVVPADRPSGPRRPLDPVGLLLISPGFAAVVYALSTAGGGAGFGDTRVLVALAAGVLLLAGYLAHALRARRTEPPVDVRLFAARGFATGVVGMFLVGAVLYGLLFLLPLYFQQARGFGPVAAGLLLVPQGAGAWIGMFLGGRLADRAGGRVMVVTGAVLAALGVAGDAVVGGTAPLAVTAVCSVLTGLGLGLIGPSAMSAVYRSVPPAKLSGGTAGIYILNQIGASLGIAVLALLLPGLAGAHQPVARFHAAFWYLTAVAAALVALGLVFPGRTRAVAPEPAAQVTEPAGSGR